MYVLFLVCLVESLKVKKKIFNYNFSRSFVACHDTQSSFHHVCLYVGYCGGSLSFFPSVSDTVIISTLFKTPTITQCHKELREALRTPQSSGGEASPSKIQIIICKDTRLHV